MLHIARFAQVQFSVALAVLLVCLAALAWRNVFGRPPAPDLVLPKWWRGAQWSQWLRARARWIDGALAVAAVGLAVLSMTTARPTAIDRGVVLHEVVQAKYHGELGWDGLYACAWMADREHERTLAGVEQLRVIEPGPAPVLEPTPSRERDEKGRFKPVKATRPPEAGGKLIPARAVSAKLDCRARFDEARWAALAADVAAVVALDPEQSLAPLFEGHGSTATPSRLARQRIVFSVLPLSAGSLFALTLLAGLATAAALALVAKAYGLRVAGLVGIVAFAELTTSPIAGGATPTGTFIAAAALAGLAALELERWGLAGALLGFVAVELVWPTLLVLALLAKLGVDSPGKRALARLAIGLGASAGLLLLLSATLPGGFGNWSTWADQVTQVRYLDGARQVGLRWLFVPEGNLLGAPRSVPYPAKAQHLVDRHSWILLCGALLLAPALLAIRRLPPVAFAAIAGVTATFALTSLEARSWGVALPLLALAAGAIGKHHGPSQPLVGRPTTVLIAGCLAVVVGMHGIVRIHQYAPFLFNVVYSHLLTTLLLGLAVALVVLPGLREHGDPPAGPPAIPVLDPETAAAPTFPLLAKLRGARKPAAGTPGGGGQ